MDKLIVKLVAELDRLKLREKTLVVFVGDNGSVNGGRVDGKKVNGGKGTMKEGGSRVPCVISWKGTTPASVVSKDLIDFSDFYPTLAEVAGARLPAGVTIDGRSFAAKLRGQEGKQRDWVYVELGQQQYVRDARWKLTGDGILSDMQEAPFGELAVEAGTEDSQAAAARETSAGGPGAVEVNASGSGTSPVIPTKSDDRSDRVAQIPIISIAVIDISFGLARHYVWPLSLRCLLIIQCATRPPRGAKFWLAQKGGTPIARPARLRQHDWPKSQPLKLPAPAGPKKVTGF
jgi:hypothetical protein